MAASWIVIAAVLLVGSAAGNPLGPARCGPQSNYAVCLDSMCCSVDGFCGYSKEFCMDRCHSQCSDNFLDDTNSNRGGGMMQTESMGSTEEMHTSSNDGSINSRKMNPASRSNESNKMIGTSNIDTNTIMTSDAFSRMFPERNSFYTYDSLIQAMKSFPEFANSGDMITQKREIAAFLAHIHHETNGLSMIDQSHSIESAFCDSTNTLYTCAAGKSYHSRGPLQITWNYNYGMAGKAVGANLLATPEMVSRDSILSFGTAIWLWMSPASMTGTSGSIHSSQNIINAIGSGKMHTTIMKENIPSCHEVMVGKWMPTKSQAAMGMSAQSFGLTTFMLDGNMECGAKADPSMQLRRAQIYSTFCRILGVEPGHNLECSAIGAV